MLRWLTRSVAATRYALAGTLALGCGDEGPFLMHRVDQQYYGTWVYIGGACLELGDSGGGTLGHRPTQSSIVTLDGSDGSATLSVFVEGERTLQRHFSRDFVASGQTTTVEFTVPHPEDEDEAEALSVRYTLWGGASCETPDPPNAEDYARALRDAGTD